MAATAISSKLFHLSRFKRNRTHKLHLQAPSVIVQISKTISFLSKSKEKKPVEKDVEGRIIVDPDVVVDYDDKHLVHREQPVEVEKKVYTEEEMQTLCNKSRLKPQDHRILNGEQPYDSPKFWTHRTARYQKRMFGRYGEKTGVNPGICWPLESEMKIRLEYESIAQPFTFHEMVDKIKAKRKAEQEEIARRAKEVETNMVKAEKAKQDHLARLGLKEKDAQAALERKEKLMEEVRRHFGYRIDERDEQFQEMLEKKEKEQRKVKKEARKLAKAQEQMRKLSEMGQQAKPETSQMKKTDTKVEAAEVTKESTEKDAETDSDTDDDEDKSKDKK